jgi:RHS repeat-associated protein
MSTSPSSRVLSSWFTGGRLRPGLQGAAMLVAAALVVTLGGVESASAATVVAPAKAKAEKVLSRPDVVSARVTARAQGARVEVESLRDEKSTTWVNPDGTLTTEQHTGQIRFKSTAGEWRDVDLTLEADADGTVSPKSHPKGLSLAGADKAAGGAAKGAAGTDLAAIDQGKGKRKQDRQVTLGWKGKLGTPTLSGTTATYADVEPGVDLTVDSRRSGYETHLVIKTPQALAALQASGKDGAVSWDIPVKTKGLTARSEKDGSVSFVDADGQVASRVAVPLAWDAVVDVKSGNHVNESPVNMTVTQKGTGKATLTLTPDQDWLTSTDRTFPITIDPTYATGSNIGPSFDTYVSSAFPTATYSTSTELRVGTYNGGADKYRSFLTFPISASGLAGKDVVSASLSLYEFHSYSCTAKPFYVYSALGATSGTNWNNQPAGGTNYGSLSVAKGFSSSCAAGRVSVPVTSMMQYWAGSGSSAGGMRLSASETDTYGWKKFYSDDSTQDPYISYTYNRKPNAAAAPTIDGWNPYVALGSGTLYNFTDEPKPTFRSIATDTDGSNVALTVEVHNANPPTATSKVASCTTVMGAQAKDKTCTLGTALSNSTTYYARVAVKDDRNLWNGTWSPLTRFFTSWTPPPAPTVSCDRGYANNTWTTADPAGTVTCTITTAGVNGDYNTPGYLSLTVDGTTTVEKIPLPWYPGSTSVTRTFAVDNRGAHSIVAKARSRSLIDSPGTTISFGWGSAALSQPAAPITTSGSFAVKAGAPPRAGSATVTGSIQWRVSGDTGAWTTSGSAVTLSAPIPSAPVQWDTSWSPASIPETTLPLRKPVTLDVQVCFTYTGVPAPVCTWGNSPITVTRVPHAFGDGYPTADAGPGQVGLYTGEFNTSTTDVSVPGYSSDLTIGRTQSSFSGDGTLTGWATDAATGVFGPGWTATLQGSNAGVAGVQVVDNTRNDGTIVLLDEEGQALVYRTPSKDRAYTPTTPWLPASPDTVDAAARLKVTGTGTGAAWKATGLTFTEEDGTVTTWAPKIYAVSSTAYVPAADVDWVPSAVQEPGQVGQTVYVPAADGSGRVTRIIAPVPPKADGTKAVSCAPTGAMAKGCRALDVEYGTTGNPGEITGQVKTVKATMWDPAVNSGVGAMATTTLATYSYDTSGRLVSVTDARSGLATTYGWDGTSTRLASVKPAGLAAYRLLYDTSTSTAPKVTSVTRDNPAGTGSAITLARYVYGVPLTGTGLPDVSGTAVAPWQQASAPTMGHGYAVFGPDYTGPVSGAGVDWKYADLQYTDDLGYTVNAASYGANAWQVTATDYEAKGNAIRELDAGATNTARAASAAGAPLSDGQIDALSTQTFYNEVRNTTGGLIAPAGTLVTDTYGPARDAALVDGTVARVRPSTHTSYDKDAPNAGSGVALNYDTGEPWRLPTSITTGVVDAAATTGSDDIEITSTTVNSYAKLNSGDGTEGDPWKLGKPTQVTTGGITQTTRYDTEGRPTETRQPMSSGTDAGTTKTIYYTADANSADSLCGNKVEWAGLVCRTKPAAAPTAGAGGAGTLPDTRNTAYNAWLQPLTVDEVSGTVTRTTKTEYDTAGRTTKTWTEVTGLSSSTPRPGTLTSYRASDGLVDKTVNLDSTHAGADPGATPATTTYDLWGRTVTTTNDLGDITTTTYIAPGNPGAGSVGTVSEDPKEKAGESPRPNNVTTYGYDGTDAAGNTEHRGLVTTQTVSRPGTAGALTYQAAYDADGKMTTQVLPGQVTQITDYDEAGEPKSLTYSGTVQPVKVRTETDPDTGAQVPVTDADGNLVYDPDGAALTNQPWLAWSVTNDTQGRVKTELTGPSAGFDGNPGVRDPANITPFDVSDAAIGYDRSYSYDAAGRLSKVADHTATEHGTDVDASPCVVRAYAFDNNGRRKTLTTDTHPDGDCTGTTGVATTSSSFNSYDTADRPTLGQGGTGQYVYDALGRQTTVPAVDSPNYATGPAAGDITLGYFDDDLPRSVAQTVAGVTTSTVFTLDSAGRRSTATTTKTGAATSTLVRHYADGSDNPAWTDKDGVITRYAESIGGDLGLTLAADGSGALTLANLHGDVVTTVPVAATATSGDAAPGIGGWSDYTEYGAPRAGSTTATTGGALGYGWLGAKQRSTTADTAGLTLMGDRLYNAVTGRFTSLDPEPGGNATAYNYPNDPINMFDLDGHWGHWRSWGRTASRWGRSAGSWAYKHRGTLATIGATAGCAVPAVGWAACAGLQAAAWGVRSQQTASTRGGWRRNAGGIARDGVLSAASFGGASTLRYLRYGRMGGRWASGLRGGFKNYHSSWQTTSRAFRWHAVASTHAASSWTVYAHRNDWRRWRNR